MAADRHQHVDPAVGQRLDEGASRQPEGEVAPGVDVDLRDRGEHRQADRDGQGREPAEAALLALLEQLVRRVDGLRQGRARGHPGHADQRDLHRHLLDQQRQPTAGTQQPPDVLLGLLEVDGMSAGLDHAPAEQVDRRPLQRLVRRGRPERTEPDHAATEERGERAGRGEHPCLGRRLHHPGDDAVELVDVDAVDDQPPGPVLEGALQGALERVRGSRHGLELVETGAEQVGQLGDAPGVDPGHVVPPLDQRPQHRGLAAARRPDDADPSLRVQGGRQDRQHVLAPDHLAAHDGHPARLPCVARGRAPGRDLPLRYVVGYVGLPMRCRRRVAAEWSCR